MLPDSDSNFSLNSSYVPSFTNCLSKSATHGSEAQKPCISLKTFINTLTIASLFDLESESDFESILNNTTSVVTCPTLSISASTIVSSILSSK